MYVAAVAAVAAVPAPRPVTIIPLLPVQRLPARLNDRCAMRASQGFSDQDLR